MTMFAASQTQRRLTPLEESPFPGFAVSARKPSCSGRSRAGDADEKNLRFGRKSRLVENLNLVRSDTGGWRNITVDAYLEVNKHHEKSPWRLEVAVRNLSGKRVTFENLLVIATLLETRVKGSPIRVWLLIDPKGEDAKLMR